MTANEKTTSSEDFDQSALGDVYHADNQRRFMALEAKMDANSKLTEKTAEEVEVLVKDMAKLKTDTASLVEMWTDAGVVFKWIRRIGAGIVTVSKWVGALTALYIAWRYGTEGK